MGILGDIIGGVTSIIGGNSQKKAAKEAAAAQVQSINQAIGYQNQGSALAQKQNSPWLVAGGSALNDQLRLLGLGDNTDWEAYVQADPAALDDYRKYWSGAPGSLGNMSLAEYGQFHYNNDGQQRDLSQFQTDPMAGIEGSPLFQSALRNSEEAIRANASATGGLRGGNIQSSLFDNRGDLLAKVFQQQFSNLGGISAQGQQTAGLLGQLGQQSAGNLGQLAVGIGNAQAGNSIAQGRISANQWNSAGSALGSVFDSIASGGFSGLGGGSGGGVGAGGGTVVTKGGHFF